jgi:hypothetical protein
MNSPRADSCWAFASQAFAPSGPSSFSKLRSFTPGTPATLYRLPCPSGRLGWCASCLGVRFFGTSGLRCSRPCSAPWTVQVRQPGCLGFESIVTISPCHTWNHCPPREEVLYGRVEGADEIFGGHVGADVQADDSAVLADLHAREAVDIGVASYWTVSGLSGELALMIWPRQIWNQPHLPTNSASAALRAGRTPRRGAFADADGDSTASFLEVNEAGQGQVLGWLRTQRAACALPSTGCACAAWVASARLWKGTPREQTATICSNECLLRDFFGHVGAVWPGCASRSRGARARPPRSSPASVAAQTPAFLPGGRR